jgi:hypothetical protein
MPRTHFMMLNRNGDHACFFFADRDMYLRCADEYRRLGWLDSDGAVEAGDARSAPSTGS